MLIEIAVGWVMQKRNTLTLNYRQRVIIGTATTGARLSVPLLARLVPQRPDKPRVECISRGFGLLESRFTRAGLALAQQTVENVPINLSRLYKQDRHCTRLAGHCATRRRHCGTELRRLRR